MNLKRRETNGGGVDKALYKFNRDNYGTFETKTNDDQSLDKIRAIDTTRRNN